MNIDVVQWCNICNAAPSEGVLTVLDEEDNELKLDACERCVATIPKERWI